MSRGKQKLKPVCTRENRLCWVEFIAGILCLMLGHIIVFIGVSIDYGNAAVVAAAAASSPTTATTVGIRATTTLPVQGLRNTTTTATTTKTTITKTTTPRLSTTTATPGVNVVTTNVFDPWAAMSPGVQGLTYFGVVLLVAGVALLVISGVHYRRLKLREPAYADVERAPPPLQQQQQQQQQQQRPAALRTSSRSLDSVLTHQSYVPATLSGASSGDLSRNDSERARAPQDPPRTQQPQPNAGRPDSGSARLPPNAQEPQQPLPASRESALERLGQWIATSTRRGPDTAAVRAAPPAPSARSSSRSQNRSAASTRAGSLDALSRQSGRSRSSSVSQLQPQPQPQPQQRPPQAAPRATNQLGHQSRQGSGRQSQPQQQRLQQQRAQSPRPRTPRQRSQSNPRAPRV